MVFGVEAEEKASEWELVIECDGLFGGGMGMRGIALLGEMYANRKRAATNKKNRLPEQASSVPRYQLTSCRGRLFKRRCCRGDHEHSLDQTIFSPLHSKLALVLVGVIYARDNTATCGMSVRLIEITTGFCAVFSVFFECDQ
jgi:hypothetical protein